MSGDRTPLLGLCEAWAGSTSGHVVGPLLGLSNSCAWKMAHVQLMDNSRGAGVFMMAGKFERVDVGAEDVTIGVPFWRKKNVPFPSRVSPLLRSGFLSLSLSLSLHLAEICCARRSSAGDR